MPFVIAKVEKETDRQELPKEIEVIVQRNREGLFQYCPKCKVEHN